MEQKLIQKIPFGSTRDRYEGRISPHYHLVCEKCGLVQDLQMPQYENINQDAQEISNFQVHRHRIAFYGICEKCRSKNRNTKNEKGGSHGNKRN